MKITTLNLQGFTDWDQRQSHITAYLTQTKPDIVLFQEVVFLPEISAYSQVDLLNQSLQYLYQHNAVTRLQVGREYEAYREGLACISNLPVLKTDTLALKKDPRDEHNRIIQLIDVLYEDQVVKLANIHFSLTDDIDFATAHLEETLEILAARNEDRIIAGDFNIDHLEDFASIWQDRYSASTSVPYVSYSSMNKRNDYVLIPKNYRFTEIKTSGDNLSDHRALTVDVSLLGKLDRSRLTDHIHLDRTRVLHGAFNFNGDIAR